MLDKLDTCFYKCQTHQQIILEKANVSYAQKRQLVSAATDNYSTESLVWIIRDEADWYFKLSESQDWQLFEYMLL